MQLRWGLCGLALVLSACDAADTQDASHAATGSEHAAGAHASAVSRADAGIPTKSEAKAGAPTGELPFGMSVYPNAKVTSDVRANQDGEIGALITMESAASPELMANHYRQLAQDAGIVLDKDDVQVGASAFLAGRKGDTVIFTYSAVRIAQGQRGVTRAQLLLSVRK